MPPKNCWSTLAGSGTAVPDHALPAHVSMSASNVPAAVWKLPAAVHRLADEQATELRVRSDPPAGSGACAAVQDEPDLVSSSPCSMPAESLKVPTAMHSLAVGQATPDNSVTTEPGPGAGGLVSAQDRPDQVSTRPPEGLAVPTATQSLMAGHATELRLVPLASAAAGSPAAPHEVPPPVSSNARESSSVPWYWYCPAAKHFAADGHAVHGDFLPRLDAGAQLADGPAVDADPAGEDEFLAVASRAHAGVGQVLVDPIHVCSLQKVGGFRGPPRGRGDSCGNQ